MTEFKHNLSIFKTNNLETPMILSVQETTSIIGIMHKRYPECKDLFTSNGNSNKSGPWFGFGKKMMDFSEIYPDYGFFLEVTTNESRWGYFFKQGKSTSFKGNPNKFKKRSFIKGLKNINDKVSNNKVIKN